MKTSEHTLKGIATGAFFALILAFIINALFSFLPIMTVFSIFMLFFVLQIAAAHFKGGILDAVVVAKKICMAALSVIAIFVIRFLLGQVLKIYPVEAYRELGNSHGLVGAFWGTSDYRVIAIEMILLALIASAIFGKSKLLRYPIGTLILVWAVLPLTIAALLTRRPVMDQQIAASINSKGIIGTVLSPIKDGAQRLESSMPTTVVVTTTAPTVAYASTIANAYHPTLIADDAALDTANDHDLSDNCESGAQIDVTPRSGIFAGFARVPHCWKTWTKEFVNYKSGQCVGWWFYNSPTALPCYGPNNLPDFDYPPMGSSPGEIPNPNPKFRMQSVCTPQGECPTIRFIRTS